MSASLTEHKEVIDKEFKKVELLCNTWTRLFKEAPQLIDDNTSWLIVEAVGVGKRCISEEMATFWRLAALYEATKSEVNIVDVRQSWFKLINKLDLVFAKFDVINKLVGYTRRRKFFVKAISKVVQGSNELYQVDFKHSVKYRQYKAMLSQDQIAKPKGPKLVQRTQSVVIRKPTRSVSLDTLARNQLQREYFWNRYEGNYNDSYDAIKSL